RCFANVVWGIWPTVHFVSVYGTRYPWHGILAKASEKATYEAHVWRPEEQVRALDHRSGCQPARDSVTGSMPGFYQTRRAGFRTCRAPRDQAHHWSSV